MTHPLSIQTNKNNNKEKGEIRGREESQKRKRWGRRCMEVQQEGKGREIRKEGRKNQQFSSSLTVQGFSSKLVCKR